MDDKTWKSLYPNKYTRIIVWLMVNVLRLPKINTKERWYHKYLPYKISCSYILREKDGLNIPSASFFIDFLRKIIKEYETDTEYAKSLGEEGTYDFLVFSALQHLIKPYILKCYLAELETPDSVPIGIVGIS